jgi:type IV pilus assembly protein PilC
MIQTGEETSCLDTMFARVSNSIELDLDNQVNMLSSALEPLLLLFVAGIVAFIVLSIFLPLYGTLNTVV